MTYPLGFNTVKVAGVLFALGESSQLALQPLRIGDAVAMLLAGAEMEREGGEDAERLVRLVGNLHLAM